AGLFKPHHLADPGEGKAAALVQGQLMGQLHRLLIHAHPSCSKQPMHPQDPLCQRSPGDGLWISTEFFLHNPMEFGIIATQANSRKEKRRNFMAKLYFKYGAMGSSKTAQALITKYNYEENDLQV